MRLATHALRAATTAPSLFLLALALLAGSASAQSVEIPVTFEEDIDYGIIGFAGADNSAVVTDPADASNRVVRVVRGANAETYAGTVVANQGLAEPIPFAPGSTTMSVRVWTPVAGTPVRFKVEDASNGMIAVESQSINSTVGGMYETIEFDLGDPGAGSLDFDATYDKLIIFFDFGTANAPEATYYFDDIAFGGGGMGGSQMDIVINEVDSDTPGIDTAEFVEFYNASSEAVSLDGLVAVFFNGSTDKSYAAFDLTGSLAAGGYYVLGNPGVPNVNQTFEPGPNGALQNGADAVALYTGSAADFSTGTDPTMSNLVSAVVYGASDPDAAGLLMALGQTIQYDENANAESSTQSVQRSPDGDDSFVTALATPGAANVIITGPQTYTALLRGANEVPLVDTDAKGGATLVLNGTSLVVSGSFSGLQSDYNANIGSHIHGGAANENKPVIIPLVPTLNDDLRGGTWEAANNMFTVRESFADSIRAGLAYVNVHSVSNPGGEIRGQIGTASQSLPFALSGDNEVPPVMTDATGSGSVTLDGSTITVSGSFSGLQSDYNANIGSHIHGGAAGMNGGIVVALVPTLDDNLRGGTWAAASNVFEVRPTFADSIRAGLAYVNVHSVDNPSGEIRGQIGTAGPVALVSFADARAAGAGATVRVQGVVTRATGDFTYLQDATGGLVIRQPSGAFKDAIVAGTIAPGTQLDVTGTLSEFRNLLQINEGDLASYEIGETVAIPTPQTVTLAQLAASGEDYESELVTVTGVMIDPEGTTEFVAGKNYQITDASDMSGTVTLRVPNAADTEIDGTAIPSQANLTGIASQFSNAPVTGSVTGYQILVIGAGDVQSTVDSEDGAGSAEPTLAVANPLRGSATVRFSLGAPGRASVTLYDALGRQVAVLADGTFGATVQSVTVEAGALATGVYVLRLQGEGAAISRTLTVVR